MNIPARFRTLPGASRKAPPIAHTCQELEDSVAARMAKYFHTRRLLVHALDDNWTRAEIQAAGLREPDNLKQVLADLEETADFVSVNPSKENCAAMVRLIRELQATLEPLLARLPEP